MFQDSVLYTFQKDFLYEQKKLILQKVIYR